MQKSKIVDIPVKMEKYFGKGKMLHPSLVEIEELISLIPATKICTIKLIAKRLAEIHDTDVTCPMRTGNAIKKIANAYTIESIDPKIPFWRVLRNDSTMIKSKNYEQWASLIEDEGFEILFIKNGNIKVNFPSESLFDFS